MRLWRWSLLLLLLGATTAAFGGRLSFQEHSAVQESLSRVHPRMQASWRRFKVEMRPGKTFTKGKLCEFRFTRSGSDSAI
jgi:hypothetical protein